MDFPSLMQGFREAATSWVGVTAFVIAAAAWLIASLKVSRNKNVLARIEKFPEEERAQVLLREFGGKYLSKGMSPEQFIKSETNFYLLIAFLATLVALVVVSVTAIQAGRIVDPHPSEARAKDEDECHYLLLKGLSSRPDMRITFITGESQPLARGYGRDLNDSVAVLRGYPPGQKLQVYFSYTYMNGQSKNATDDFITFDRNVRYYNIGQKGDPTSSDPEKKWGILVDPTDAATFNRHVAQNRLNIRLCNEYRPGVNFIEP